MCRTVVTFTFRYQCNQTFAIHSQVAALSNKAYDTKADVFGLQNDVSSLKAKDENLSAEVKAAIDTVDSVANQRSRDGETMQWETHFLLEM